MRREVSLTYTHFFKTHGALFQAWLCYWHSVNSLPPFRLKNSYVNKGRTSPALRHYRLGEKGQGTGLVRWGKRDSLQNRRGLVFLR